MIIQSPQLQQFTNFIHGFGTRKGGVSENLYCSANMKSKANDPYENALENRRRFAQNLGFDVSKLIMMFQTHSSDVVVVDQTHIGTTPKADALITLEKGIILAVLTADCVPVLVADPLSSACAVIHAGWRGAVQGIITNTFEKLHSLGVYAENCVASIGPSIDQTSYEVTQDVLDACNNSLFFKPNNRGRWQFDLKGYVFDQLKLAGVKSIEASEEDTYQNEELFFSYRRATHRNESDYGNQMSVIGVKV